jgi:phage shock protein PspC (stress-responsive transcriptional regulator)
MSIAAEIERLSELRTRGLLTEDEFARAKARLLDQSAGRVDGDTAPAMAAVGRLRRSRSDRWLGGVCGGIARSLGAETWVLRLLLVLLAFFGGTGLLVYILLWIFVPNE